MTTTTEKTTTTKSEDQVRQIVRDHYAGVATGTGPNPCAPGCCGTTPDASLALGYSAEELAAVPDGANMGLGCGNPQAIAALRPGERVLDLGSGGGFDCFLAARQVGPTGRVIGVDMTPAMLSKARENAVTLGAGNVEFRLGEIEHLPVGDGEVDVVLSNCVINLSPDKGRVFREAFRALAPGGRLAISDVVATAPIPKALRDDVLALAGCVAGAIPVAEIEQLLGDAGFTDVRVEIVGGSKAFISEWFPGTGAEEVIASASIQATKPGGGCCAPTCCG